MMLKLLKKKEVAALLAMATRSVDRLVAKGALQPVKILGATRFKEQDVIRLIEQGGK